MFDVGFSELLVIGVVALVVIGPERLPAVARTAGVLLARLQRYVNGVKADINREIHLDELKRLQQQVAEQARNVETAVSQEMRAVESSLQTSVEDLEKAFVPVPPTDAALSADVPAATDTSVATAAALPLTPDADAMPVAANQLELGLGPAEDRKV